MFKNVKVGDIVTRNMCEILIKMQVAKVDDKLIYCQLYKPEGKWAELAKDAIWTFDRQTGAEIDDELGWGNARTGSYLMKVEGEANA